MLVLTAAVACAAFMPFRVAAQPDLDAEVAAPRTPRVLREAASRVPADVSTLIVADGLASVRREPGGKSAMRLIETLDAFGESRAAWNQLALQMETTPGEAFDALLGTHAIFITRDTGVGAGRNGNEAGEASWAMMSRVSIGAAKRLGVALKATPRSEQGGLPVFALENGAYLLHIRAESDSRTAWITVGPGDRPELFRLMTSPPPAPPARDGAGGTLMDRPEFMRAIAALPEAADAFVYRRLGPADAPAEFLAGAVRIAGNSAVISYTTHTSMERDDATGWSRPSFDALSGGGRALVALVASGSTTMGELFERHLEPLRPLFDRFEHPDLLGARSALSVMRTPGGSLGVAFAVETPDTRALTDEADRYMARFLARLFPPKLNAEQRLDVTGLAPSAMRTVNMQGTAPASVLRDPDGPVCAWVVAAGERADGAPATDGADAPTPGWWISGIDPPTVARSVGVLARPGEPGEWSALGLIRPAELAATARSLGGLLLHDRTLGAMALIDRVALAERWIGNGRVVGSVNVDFAPPAPPTPPGAAPPARNDPGG